MGEEVVTRGKGREGTIHSESRQGHGSRRVRGGGGLWSLHHLSQHNCSKHLLSDVLAVVY